MAAATLVGASRKGFLGKIKKGVPSLATSASPEITHNDILDIVGFNPANEYTQAELTKMAKQTVKLEKKHGIDEPLEGAFEDTVFDKASRAWARFHARRVGDNITALQKAQTARAISNLADEDRPVGPR